VSIRVFKEMPMYDIWIDISNTPQVHVMRSLINALSGYTIYVTAFRRGEVAELLESYGVKATVFGQDKESSLHRSLTFAWRAIQLALYKAPKAKVLLSCENAMPIIAAKIKSMRVVLILDNDLKFKSGRLVFQRIENFIKEMADYILVPEVTAPVFEKLLGKNLYTYPGFKEHIYIADYRPDPEFPSKIPFKEYVVIRPESLSSLYVQHTKSIVPELLRLFEREGINVVYLPRNEAERALALNFKNVYIPSTPLNGLDLIYYSSATLTGSGTMAREAALLGVTAVSFFPGKTLLAVDKELVKQGKIFYSRNPEEIVEYVITNWSKRREPSFREAVKVKMFVAKVVKNVIEETKLRQD